MIKKRYVVYVLCSFLAISSLFLFAEYNFSKSYDISHIDDIPLKKYNLTQQEKDFIKNTDTIKIWAFNKPPLIAYDNEVATGLVVDFLDYISKKAGLNIKFVSNNQGLDFLEKRVRNNIYDFDVFPLVPPIEKWESVFNFSDVYINMPRVIFAHKNDDYIKTLQDLKDKKISIEKHYPLIETLRQKYPDIKLIIKKNTKQALQSLAIGEADAYIGDIATGAYQIRKEGYTNIKVMATELSLGDVNIAFGVRKDLKHLASILTKLHKVTPESVKNAIRNKWLSLKLDYGISKKDVVKWVAFISIFFSIILVLVFMWNRLLQEEILRRKEVEKKLKESEKLFRSVFENAAVGIAITDAEGNLIKINKSWIEKLKLSETKIEKKLSLFEITHDHHAKKTKENFKKLVAGEIPSYRIIKKYKKTNGDVFWGDASVSVVLDDDNNVEKIIGVIIDISKQKHLEENLYKLATTDYLTNFCNRRQISNLLEDCVNRHYRNKTPFSVIMFDIDKFKVINDTYGHDIGDEVLRNLSNHVQDIIRKTDYIGRIGGEEFLLLLENTDEKGAYQLAEKIRKNIEKTKVLTSKGEIGFTISLGVYQLKEEKEMTQLLKKVDEKLYIAKETGRNKTIA